MSDSTGINLFAIAILNYSIYRVCALNDWKYPLTRDRLINWQMNQTVQATQRRRSEVDGSNI